MIKNKWFLLIIILSVFLYGCGNQRNISNSSEEETIGQTSQNEKTDNLKQQIEEMSLKEKIGQMVIVGLEGYEVGVDALEMIEGHKVGGFILFNRNISDINQMINLINSLKEANAKNKIPLFLAVDEEGGRVTRMPNDFIKLPSNEKIGQVGDEVFSFEIGNVIGEQLKLSGFNMDFAPVLDINSNPQNPVIGDRSFGDCEETVCKLGISAMKGIQNHVISVVKHFPGHGDTSVDSHIDLPVVDKSFQELKRLELKPFIKAIESDADAVMIAHILLPKVDSEYPATLSKKIVTDILRRKMKFDGVVITDDMTMRAIVGNYDIGKAAVKAVQAGNDIILVCHGKQEQLKVIKSLEMAVANKTISEDVINERVYRILKLKQKYKLNDEKIENVNTDSTNKKAENVLNQYLK